MDTNNHKFIKEMNDLIKKDEKLFLANLNQIDCDKMGFGDSFIEGLDEILSSDKEEKLAKASSGYWLNDVYVNKKITPYNYTRKNNIGRIRYIVIHYTGAAGTAANNATYFARQYVGASAHYFVDSSSVWQCVEDKDASWHCGGGLQGSGGHSYYKICTNSNSIGIEMCVKRNSAGAFYFEQATIDKTVKLVVALLKKYKLGMDRVIRHYDVTGKICPEPYVKYPNQYTAFRNQLKEEMEGDIDMTTAENLQNQINNLNNSVQQLVAAINKQNETFDWVTACPEWAQNTIHRLYTNGIIKGDDNGQLKLSYDMIRMLVVLDRAGVFADIK